MRLWVRLAAVIAAVATALVAVTGLVAVDISTDKATASSRAILERDAGALATFVGTWTAEQADAVEGWAQAWNLDLSPAHQVGLQQAVYRAIPSVVTVALVGPDGLPVVDPLFATPDLLQDDRLAGRMVGSAPRADALLARLPISAAFERPGRRAVGDPYLPPDGAAPSLPVAVGKPGSRVLLGVEISLADIESLVREQSGEEYGVALLDGAGQTLIGGDHPLVDATRLRPLIGIGTDSWFEMSLEDGRAITGAVTAVPQTDWTVVVAEPAEVAARAGREIRGRTVQVVAISVLLAVLVGAVTARSLVGPVARMRDSANAVAEGDYGRRVSIDRADELGDLARAFNHMSERLEHNRREIRLQQDEIETFNRELQARVEERTQELRDAQKRLVQSGQLAAVAQVGASLAHELNNPLAGILGLAQVLRARHPEDAEGKMLERLEEQASRCREVVAAMLRFSAGELDPSAAPVVDLADVLRDVSGLVGGPFRQRGVALELREPDEPLRARIDPGHASRIVAQVLTTLVAGLPEGAGVRVEGRRRDGEVEIALTPDRPVAVGDARDDWMASGMGLWVARQMLERAGGRLDEPTADGSPWRLFVPGAE